MEKLPETVMLILRATVAFLALPTLVAGIVPALIVRSQTVADRSIPAAAVLFGLGGVLLFWCVRDFFVSGKGTLAPWDPPRHLVIVGLYRFVRNPMYLAVLTLVAGWSVLYRSVSVAIYALVLAAAFHARVILHEEPWLRRQFGAEWETYSATTARWLPGRRKKPK
jgi:protein-S-isoprenylcysteine O-methyltransferase Ste14